MTFTDIYVHAHRRLAALAADLDPAAAGRPVPALPGWTVLDTYRHLAGVTADVRRGRTDGAPGAAWTARHLAQRRDADLAAVVAEWAGDVPAVAALLAGERGIRYGLTALDAWHHQYDIAGALEHAVPPEPAEVALALDYQAESLRRRWPAGLPALRVRSAEGGSWQLGAGEPGATLTAPGFTLARAFVGRRSGTQLRHLDWTTDPTPYLPHLTIFTPPAADVAP
ncbi:hypothetical protein GCM10010124_24960 [Pilimelia terevasa]|uniref:Mycothiol-dependent maleylpyruvate isomerase metal-binding domain-containing protein n=1 Tax=Pilimelia terevasa TaxID=53372 RepID=A0A8J3BSM3_9ACTN|nr:maleylpyruvate isomerase N-terminal domain-containing protein [Pilimelia terevasa]GGK31118.1 hypothetical protein GCM10010124_24960 [Pilimelia terevasa]